MGNGIRARRRDSKKYVWAVYTAVYKIVSAESGSFTLSGAFQTIKTATDYTINSDGTFSLVDASSSYASGIAAGMYLVDTRLGSTAITGEVLYYVTKTGYMATGSGSYVISYDSYVAELQKGVDTGERVKSKTLDYPENGIQGDYWYVLL